MTSRTERFERKPNSKPDNKPEENGEEEVIRFSPEEEAVRTSLPLQPFQSTDVKGTQTLLNESNELKTQANKSFAAGEYKDAIETYTKSLQSCPKYLHYERAVLSSNIAACYLKTSEWKDAVKVAGDCLDLLDFAEGKTKKRDGDGAEDKDGRGEDEGVAEEEADEEIISPGAAKAEDTSVEARRKTDIERIRSKALLRRGKARMEIGSWSSLQGAEEGRFGFLPTMYRV
jgi:tetratricopeptide (TPR) repeat protein